VEKRAFNESLVIQIMHQTNERTLSFKLLKENTRLLCVPSLFNPKMKPPPPPPEFNK